MDVFNKRFIAGAMKMDENMTNKKKDKDDDDNNKDMSAELEEPIPRNDHKYCHICKTKFEKYIKHIKCFSHFENLQRNKPFFNRLKRSFERILNFWDFKKGRIQKKNNTIEENTTKLLSPIKSEEISTKESSLQGKNIINNIINLLNNKNNNENINNNSNKIFNNTNIYEKDINYNKNNIDKKVNSNIDLNKATKLCQNNHLFNYINNINYKERKEEKPNNKIFKSYYAQNLVKKKFNDNYIFSLTYNNNFINDNIRGKNIFNNIKRNNENNDNSIKTINYISIRENDEENFINPYKNKIKNDKEEKIVIQYKKKFVTKCYPKFSTLQTYQIPKPKKRKRNDYKTGDIFIISTPKKIEIDYFPVLSMDNPKKLINKTLVFFQ